MPTPTNDRIHCGGTNGGPVRFDHVCTHSILCRDGAMVIYKIMKIKTRLRLLFRRLLYLARRPCVRVPLLHQKDTSIASLSDSNA